MTSRPDGLTPTEVFELAALLAGVASVRHRFIPFGPAAPARSHSGQTSGEPFLHERTKALARAGLYNFLAATFAEPPSQPYLEGLHQSGAIEILAHRGFGGESFRVWGQSWDGGREVARELPSAYSRAFIRPGSGFIPLLASAYPPPGTSTESAADLTLSHGPAAEAVEAAYREAGLVVGGDGPITPQHLAVELQFMHHGAACEAAAWGDEDLARSESWRERQRSFLTHHLRPWTGALAHRIALADVHPFYRALVDLLVRFLAADSLELADSGLVPIR
jgi:TorA maturation chaperone TorD